MFTWTQMVTFSPNIIDIQALHVEHHAMTFEQCSLEVCLQNIPMLINMTGQICDNVAVYASLSHLH